MHQIIDFQNKIKPSEMHKELNNELIETEINNTNYNLSAIINPFNNRTLNTETNEISKTKRIKQRVKEIMLDSTSHGIPQYLRSDIFALKIMWICSFIVCTSLGFFLVTQEISSYLEFEVVTKIDILDDYPIQFPTISLQFDTGFSKANYSLEENIIKLFYSNVLIQNILNEFEQLNFNSVYYKFNSGKNMTNHSIDFKNQDIIGEIGGLNTEIFIGQPDEFTAFPDKIPSTHSNFFGIYIHNESMDPVESNEDPIKLSPGFHTDIKINRVHTDRLGFPYNDCIKDLETLKSYDSILVKHILTKTQSAYRQNDCLNLCKMKYAIEKCNYPFQIGFSWEIQAQFRFMNKSLRNCINNESSNFLKKNPFIICGSLCPSECDSYEYKIEYMTSKFPSKSYAKILMQDQKIISKYPAGYNITLEDLRESLVSFNIYYESFQYTRIQQLPKKDIVEVISNFGGTLGLFLGISFLSFFEIFQLLYEIFVIYFGID